MFPPGHLALAYLLTSLLVRVRGERVTASVAAAAALGSQVPDLIDKPLAWLLGLRASRTVGHSLVFVVVLALVTAVVTRPVGGWRAGASFVLGLGSHLLADAAPALFRGDRTGSFLLWPFDTTTPYDEPYPGLDTLLTTVASEPSLVVEVGLVLAAAWYWREDGYPGAATLGVGHTAGED
jgi:Predicted membrane-bound metal-dependent hydrolase (DUF457).